MKKCLGTLCFSLILCSVCMSCSDHAEDTITKTSAAEFYAEEELRWVEAATGAKLSSTLRIISVTRDELVTAMREQAYPLVEKLYKKDNPESFECGFDLGIEVMSKGVFALFSPEKKSILLCGENESIFYRREDLKAVEEGRLKAGYIATPLYVHEFIHAADEEKFQLFKKRNEFSTKEQLQVSKYLAEGHAQYLGRIICEKHGWGREFQVLSDIVTHIPEEFLKDKPVDEQKKALAFLNTSYYRDGEVFFAAVHQSGGDEALNAIFSSPPIDVDEILHPEKYLARVRSVK